MEQQETDRQTAILKQVLANLADKRLHIYELQNLVNYYPQSNLLYALIARSGNAEQVRSAAAYYQSQSLYKLVHGTEPLTEVDPAQLVNLDRVEPDVPTLEEVSVSKEFEDYEPTIEDLALAEINKRKFGSETEWTSFDPDAEEVQEQLYEPEQITSQSQKETPIAETALPEPIQPEPEAVPLVSEEPVVVVPDTSGAEHQIFPEPVEPVHNFQQDWYQQPEKMPEQDAFNAGEDNQQDIPHQSESTGQPAEAHPYNPSAGTVGSQWQSLNFEELDKQSQPGNYDNQIAAATPEATDEFVGIEPEILPALPEETVSSQYIYTEQIEPVTGIEPELLGAIDDQPEETAAAQPAMFEDRTASAFIPYMQKAEEQLQNQAPVVENDNKANAADTSAFTEVSAIDEEIFDEIVGIEDIFIAHVPKAVPPVVVPPVTANSTERPYEQKAPEQPEVSADEVVQRVEQAAAETPVAEEIPVPLEASFASQQEPVDVKSETPLSQEPVVPAVEIEQPVSTNTPVVEEPAQNLHSKESIAEFENLIAESIVSAGYFSYRESLVKEEPQPVTQQPVVPTAETTDEKQVVTKYHDDNMPYTFLWWLDKTRRDHSNVYQPYAKPAQLPTIDELQQEQQVPKQLIEPKRKEEEEIIERFIKEEPQIKPPSSDKLDNENKARNSAEDSDELVTETLARIYVDQMLYHKAIATYKKLMLRFPEKNSYFAGQIKELENKIN